MHFVVSSAHVRATRLHFLVAHDQDEVVLVKLRIAHLLVNRESWIQLGVHLEPGFVKLFANAFRIFVVSSSDREDNCLPWRQPEGPLEKEEQKEW